MTTGYLYVDTLDPNDGKRWRHIGSMKAVGRMDANAPNVQDDLKRNPNYDLNIYRFVLDKAGMGVLMKDASGRHMLIRRHGAAFVARLLDRHSESRLDHNFLTIGTGEKTFGKVTLNLGKDAQYWAAGLRHMAV